MNTADLRTIMRALDIDPSDEEMEDYLKIVDKNERGSFSMLGLMEIMEDKLRDIDTLDDLIDQFALLDKNNDGQISNPEFKQFMMNLGGKLPEEEVENMIKEADSRGDGFITIEEFASLLMPPKE